MADIEPIDALSLRQHKALEALLAEATIAKAAKTAEVPERTLYTWLRTDAAFVDAYRAARREAVSQAVARLQHHSSSAVTVLLGIMASKTAADATRLAAAVKVLEMAHRAVELDDVVARLEALEAAHVAINEQAP